MKEPHSAHRLRSLIVLSHREISEVDVLFRGMQVQLIEILRHGFAEQATVLDRTRILRFNGLVWQDLANDKLWKSPNAKIWP